MRNVATIGLACGIGWLATACTLDMNVGEWIKPNLDPGGNGSGSGGKGGGSGTGSSGSASGKKSEDTDPPTVPACIEQEQGSATSCKDVATWKQYASQACESSNLQLTDYVPEQDCGNGAFRYVGYTCCPKPVPPPPPPPPPSKCIDQKQGGATSCKDASTWKLEASLACEGSGLQLADYLPEEECGKDGFRYVSYTCCPKDAPPPPPPPNNCIDEEQGDATSCKDAYTWKQNARLACESSGRQLIDYVPREECGPGLFRYVGYTCCPNAAPPPSSCIEQEQGSDTSCKDIATWKQNASLGCESSGLQLTDYAAREACGEGLFRYVDYTCCPKAEPPPPPPPPSNCVVESQGGDGASCKDPFTWKQEAAQGCASSGLVMTSYETQDQCGEELFRYVKYTCCSL